MEYARFQARIATIVPIVPPIAIIPNHAVDSLMVGFFRLRISNHLHIQYTLDISPDYSKKIHELYRYSVIDSSLGDI